MRNTIFGFALFFCLASWLLGQEPKKSSSTPTARTTTPSTDKDEKQTDLTQIELRFGTISIPSNLKKKDKKCYEGGCWEFADDEMTLTVDWNDAAWRPTFEKQNADYTEDYVLVDGVRTKMWSWPNGGNYRFISGATFAIERGHKVGLGIYLSSKSQDTRELAKKIFSSVKFAPNVNKND